jgi:DNA-binding beta-propeller fold protein YncE
MLHRRGRRAWVFSLLAAFGVLSYPAETSPPAFPLLDSRPLDGLVCPLPAAFGSAAVQGQHHTGDVAPVRVVRDPYPVPASIAVDPVNDIVAMSDENLFSLRLYDRAIKQTGVAEPRRTISGSRTHVEFICGVAVDPVRKELYASNNDTLARAVVFSYDQSGNVAPVRELDTGKAAGIFLDLKNGELALANQHENRVLFFRNLAGPDEGPLRVIQGPKTGLADPHGVYVDADHGEVVVTNYGSWHPERMGDQLDRIRPQLDAALFRPAAPSEGTFEPPSVRIYSRTAAGDVAPLRTIQGARTRLNLPGGVWMDAERGEILVANDGGDSILVFDRRAAGDVAPIRTIEGPATRLKNPTAVVIDPVHGEMWVSNWGDHSATVYRRGASGDVEPLRTIRTGPEGAPTPGLGNPGGITYDRGREQILVPN